MDFTSTSASADALHARATRKVMLHLLPVMFAIYFMSYIDRTNVALAKTHWRPTQPFIDLARTRICGTGQERRGT
jgi:hypothetical protein